MITTGSKSLQLLPVALFTTFKNATIVFIALSEFLFFNQKLNRYMFLAFFLIISSSITGIANDVNFSIEGYYWMLLNCISSALYVLLMQRQSKQLRFENFDIVYYNNCLAIPVLIIASVYFDDWKHFKYRLTQINLLETFLFVILSSFAAFLISFSSAWCTKTVTSTTFSMVGALNKLPISICGLLFFEEERNSLNTGVLASITIAFLSGITYAYSKTYNNSKKFEFEKLTKSRMEEGILPLYIISQNDVDKRQQSH